MVTGTVTVTGQSLVLEGALVEVPFEGVDEVSVGSGMLELPAQPLDVSNSLSEKVPFQSVPSHELRTTSSKLDAVGGGVVFGIEAFHVGEYVGIEPVEPTSWLTECVELG
jgi:hypothetical protein